jgi:hypothetical protein
MDHAANEKLTAIKRQLLDGMVRYMNTDGVAESYDSFYDQTQIMTLVERVVVALNHLNESCSHSMIETDQREDICAFIEEAIIASGTDLDDLAASLNCTRHEITDEWRDW